MLSTRSWLSAVVNRAASHHINSEAARGSAGRRATARSRNAARGFSLVELMVAITVLGILMTAAVPMFAVWIGNSKIRTAAESVYAGLQIAKQESVRRNARVLFRATDANSTTWTICPVGVGTFACDPLQPPIQVRDGGEESNSVRIGASADTTTINVGAFGAALAPGSGVPASVMFDSMGRTVITPGWVNAVRFDFRDPNMSAANERRLVVVVSPAGSPRMCDPQVPVGNPRSC